MLVPAGTSTEVRPGAVEQVGRVRWLDHIAVLAASAGQRVRSRSGLTEAERELIRQAASARGRGVSLARFVAEADLAAAGAPPVAVRRRSPSRLALAEIADATAAVNRIGNNLNQLAREKNTTGLTPVGAADEIQRALAVLRRLADTVEAADP